MLAKHHSSRMAEHEPSSLETAGSETRNTQNSAVESFSKGLGPERTAKLRDSLDAFVSGARETGLLSGLVFGVVPGEARISVWHVWRQSSDEPAPDGLFELNRLVTDFLESTADIASVDVRAINQADLNNLLGYCKQHHVKTHHTPFGETW